MATYAIGDIQGCDVTLGRLLARAGFDAARDRLWLVGDLVNRGTGSLAVLRRVRALGERAVTVLGNHDVHLIGRALGVAPAKRRDTLDEVLAAPDAAELIGWLRARPMLHCEENRVLVHAGLLPSWTVDEAARLARAVEAELAGPGAAALFGEKKNDDGLRAALAVFTRLRACTADEKMCDFDGPPSEAPPGCRPWFAVPGRRSAGAATIVFGHWSALGLHLQPDAIGLDTGCVWGRALTAVRLEDRAIFSEPAAAADLVSHADHDRRR